MSRRWPVTLWLHILADLWKLVALTTAVLVTVLAFAVTIKPLADGKLDLFTATKWMVLATVPMLQYALPFAACFAATLAYHRMSADNEVTAAYAGGVGHRALLVPAAASGLAIAGALLFLNNWAIPRSFRVMAEIITHDASRVIVSTIKRHEAVEFERTLVYADTVVEQGPDEASGAYQRLWLGGLLVVKLDKEGRVESQGSARNAAVWLKRASRASGGGAVDQAVTEVIVKPTDFVATGDALRVGGIDTVLTFVVPNTLSDNPKYLSFGELKALRAAPERMNFIERLRRELAVQLAAREAVDVVRRRLRDSGECELRDPFGQKIVVRGGGLRPTSRAGVREPSVLQIVPAPGATQVVVERTTTEGRTQRQAAASAYLRLPVRPNPGHDGVPLTVDLRDVVAEPLPARPGEEEEVEAPPELGAPGRGEVKERPFTDLVLADDPARGLLAQNTWGLERLASQRAKQGRPADRDALAKPTRDLTERVGDLMREVMSKEQERYAMSAACLVMVIVGAVMAMRLRDALPLTIYLWAFFPALATVLAISGGQQLTHGQGVIGLPVLWSGVVVLGMYTLFEFARLIRH